MNNMIISKNADYSCAFNLLCSDACNVCIGLRRFIYEEVCENMNATKVAVNTDGKLKFYNERIYRER